VQETTAYMLDRQKLKIDRAVAQQSTVKDKLIFFFKASVAPSGLSIPGGCPMLNLGLEADDTNPDIRRQILKLTEKMQTDIANLVREGVRNGEFNAAFHAEEFAIRSFAMLEGGIFLSKLSGTGKKLAIILRSIIAEIESHSS